MFFSDIINQVNQIFISLDATSIPNYLIFLVFALGAIFIGKYTSAMLSIVIKNFIPGARQEITNNFLHPLKKPFQLAGTCLLISLSSAWLIDYQQFYKLFHPLIVFSVVASLGWLASRIFRQLIRIYGVKIISKSGLENELLLVFETVANILIGFVGLVSYAQSQKFPLTGLLASVSIGGIAISFSASKTLEQLFGTIVLFLDRPFIPGDYIRCSLGGGDIYGRVESIGLRSTKVRVAATGTLYIVPNNKLADTAIENITRGKKVMVLLYLDFTKKLTEQEEAVVQQVAINSKDSLLGMEPGSLKITIFEHETTGKSRARMTFFILGSSENSIQLRKQLLEVANQNFSKELKKFGIEFKMQEPNIYVDTPITI